MCKNDRFSKHKNQNNSLKLHLISLFQGREIFNMRSTRPLTND